MSLNNYLLRFLKPSSTISRLNLGSLCGRNNPRSYSVKFSLKPKVFKEADLLRKDKIAGGYQLIYRAPMLRYVVTAQHVATFTTITVAALTIYQFWSGDEYIGFNVDTRVGLVSEPGDLKFFLAGFFLINLLVQIVIYRYPLRIYQNQKRYIAVFEGFLPTLRRKLNFSRGEVKQLTSIGILPWNESLYRIKKQKAVIFEDYFKTPSALNLMIGNDKNSWK